MNKNEFLTKLQRMYPNAGRETDVFGRAPASARMIEQAMTGSSGLTTKEQEQLDDIHRQTGVSMSVITSFFIVKGRYWGERKRSFINSVNDGERKHGPHFAIYILSEHIDSNGKIRVGDVLAYRASRQ